jgi:hypothetical protein
LLSSKGSFNLCRYGEERDAARADAAAARRGRANAVERAVDGRAYHLLTIDLLKPHLSCFNLFTTTNESK